MGGVRLSRVMGALLHWQSGFDGVVWTAACMPVWTEPITAATGHAAAAERLAPFGEWCFVVGYISSVWISGGGFLESTSGRYCFVGG